MLPATAQTPGGVPRFTRRGRHPESWPCRKSRRPLQPPTSLSRGSAICSYQHEPDTKRFAEACENSCQSRGGRPIAADGHGVPQPECTDNCYRNLPSVSLLFSCCHCLAVRGRESKRSQNGLQSLADVGQKRAASLGHNLCLFGGEIRSGTRQTLGQENGSEFVNGLFQAVVNQNIVVKVIILNLFR